PAGDHRFPQSVSRGSDPAATPATQLRSTGDVPGGRSGDQVARGGARGRSAPAALHDQEKLSRHGSPTEEVTVIRLYHLDPRTDWLGGARNGAKVVIALAELGIEHQVIHIDRRRDMRDPGSEFRRRVNPWGTVPVLDHDGFLLRESAAILRY